MRFLYFNPYTPISAIGANFQGLLLHAIAARRWDVFSVVCDGMFDVCDLTQPSQAHSFARDPRPCVKCQYVTAMYQMQFSQKYAWLGRWRLSEDEETARRWAGSALTSLENPFSATFDELPLGRWVKSSCRTHFQYWNFDVRSQEIRKLALQYLYVGCLAYLAINRLIDDVSPDRSLVFNGRSYPTRIFLEVSKSKNVPVYAFEEYHSINKFWFARNHSTVDAEFIWEAWSEYKDRPLRPDQCETIKAWLKDRSVRGFRESSPHLTDQDPRTELGVSADARLVPLFLGGNKEHPDEPMSGYLGQQHAVDTVLETAKRRPDVTFAVRGHPGMSDKKIAYRGATKDGLLYFEELKKKCAATPNVKIISPDDPIDSHRLIRSADAVLVWNSSLAPEAVLHGKPVMEMGGERLRYCEFVVKGHSPQSFEDDLESLLSGEGSRITMVDKRHAIRYLNMVLFDLFIAVEQLEVAANNITSLKIKSLSEIAPGRAGNLDKIVDLLLYDADWRPPRPVGDADHRFEDELIENFEVR